MISSDARAISNVVIDPVPSDTLLSIPLRSFTMKYEFDNGCTPYHTWLA